MSASDKDKSAYGHRKRLKEKLLSSGASNMSDADIIEMLLFYIVPRKDCRAVAEALVEKYGTLEAVIAADPRELREFKYLKDGAEVLFTLLGEVVKRASIIEGDRSMLEGDRLKTYLLEIFKDKEAETVYALYFAEDGSYLGKQVIHRGNISSARFSLRTVTEGVIRIGGKSVVLAHNHPSDMLVPSSDDIISTKRIAAHLAATDIDLIDHYIVGTDDAVSIFKVK